MYPIHGDGEPIKPGERIVPKKEEVKKEKSEFKFCVKCVWLAILDIIGMLFKSRK